MHAVPGTLRLRLKVPAVGWNKMGRLANRMTYKQHQSILSHSTSLLYIYIYIPFHIITIMNLIIITIMIVTIVFTSTTICIITILHIVHCIIKPVHKDLQFAGTAESR